MKEVKVCPRCGRPVIILAYLNKRTGNAEMICAALNAGEEELAKAILTADRAGRIWEPVEVH